MQGYLTGLTCNNLRSEILENPNYIKDLKSVCKSIKEIIDDNNGKKDVLDNIQDVLFYTCKIQDDATGFCQHILVESLLTEGVLKSKTNVIIGSQTNFGEELCTGAMKKPHTMIQVANTLLPPLILDQYDNPLIHDTQLLKQVLSRSKELENPDLFPPNIFYVQAEINEDCISFVLNKVFEVNSAEGVVQKSVFSVKEKTIVGENIFDSVCENILNHLQMIDDNGFESFIQKCAQRQNAITLCRENYSLICTNLKLAIKESVNIN